MRRARIGPVLVLVLAGCAGRGSGTGGGASSAVAPGSVSATTSRLATAAPASAATTASPPATPPPGGTTPAPRAPAPQFVPPFVKVDRTRACFTLGGKPFYFAGTNAYYLAQELAYGSTVSLDALDAAKSTGSRVVRTWGFNNNANAGAPNDASVIQVSPGVYQDSGWKAMDAVLAECAKRGLHLIVTLVNNWDEYGGMNRYVSWAGLSGHDLFFTDPGVKQLYKNYVRDFVSHVSSITGVAYKDDPTILGWELANEARCNSDLGAASGTLVRWYAEMSAYLKSLDSNHLVATGEEGFDVTTSGYTSFTSYTTYFAIAAWTFGTSFTANTALPDIDWAGVHLYPDLWHWLLPELDGANWIRDHAALANASGKPLLVGEYGLETTPHAVYKTWLDTVAGSNAAGALVWELVPASRSAQAPETTNVVYPTETVDVANLSAAAAVLNAK